MTDPSFVLDPRLAADTVPVCELPLSRVLLLDDARFPWLVLVPRRQHAVELFDLAAADRHRLLDEISAAAAALRTLCQPDKLNIAALGNVVAQLHVHVIARFASDCAWPQPVWGVGKAAPYSPAARDDRCAQLQRLLRAAI